MGVPLISKLIAVKSPFTLSLKHLFNCIVEIKTKPRWQLLSLVGVFNLGCFHFPWAVSLRANPAFPALPSFLTCQICIHPRQFLAGDKL